MKTNSRILLSILIAAVLLAPCALAESITFSGTVTASATHEVYAPIGGKVEAVNGEAGGRVSAGDVLVSLSTTKVYAEEAGTVTGVFAQPGDSAETVSQKYGAVMYLEGESVYSVSASTDNAYNATENAPRYSFEEKPLLIVEPGRSLSELEGIPAIRRSHREKK